MTDDLLGFRSMSPRFIARIWFVRGFDKPAPASVRYLVSLEARQSDVPRAKPARRGARVREGSDVDSDEVTEIKSIG